MKSFIFVLFLWTLAISQIFKSSPENSDAHPNLVRIENKSSDFKPSEKLFCRDDISEKDSFEISFETVVLEVSCDQKYSNHQIEVSEAREQYEHKVLMSLSLAEVTLAGSN